MASTSREHHPAACAPLGVPREHLVATPDPSGVGAELASARAEAEGAGTMPTATTATDLRGHLDAWHRAGLTVGFVPTMGALHEGHLSLVRLAAERADRVVASVFVNPTQFGPGEDLAAYPRDPEGDAAQLTGAGCHLLFLPEVETVYPPGATTRVEVAGPPAEGLEGEHRPGHFAGVATVVTQLFGLVRPDLAVFGEKDAQQLAVVRRLARDLHLGVEIVAGPTVREPDGLALSSRNAYLTAGERRAAAVLYRALSAGRRLIEQGERNAETARRAMREVFAAEPLASLQYAEVVDAESFRPVARAAGRLVLPAAAMVGRARLIDNLRVTTRD